MKSKPPKKIKEKKDKEVRKNWNQHMVGQRQTGGTEF